MNWDDKLKIYSTWNQRQLTRKRHVQDNEYNGMAIAMHMETNQLDWTFENLDKAVLALGDISLGGKLVMVDRRHAMEVSSHASRKRGKETAEQQARAAIQKLKPVDSPQFKRENAQAKVEFERLVRNYSERYVKCRCYGLGGTGIPRAAHRAI
jgi:hypothetical protein